LKKPIPRISTRGYFDLSTGKTIKNNKYFLYPKKSFESLSKQKEIAIMIHGLRNNPQGGVNKFEIAKRRLMQLGYQYPVIGFSYDSNTKGAHLKKFEVRALRVGQRIAQKNGKNLAQFVIDFKKKNPKTKIRFLGHSLGTEVILSTIEYLSRKAKVDGIIESVHFFGSSITNDVPSSKKFGKLLQKIVNKKIMNYFNPKDEVLKYAHESRQVKNPLGLFGTSRKPISKYTQKLVHPKNHRFVSYAKKLNNFP